MSQPRWHLPPVLGAFPHKQIKQLHLPPSSCLHFTLMTLHLHLSSVSPSPLHFFLDSHWAVIYMQILKCDCGEGKKGEEKEKKTKKRTGLRSYRKINIAPAIFAGNPPFPIRFSSTDWPQLSRESDACCLQSQVKGWRCGECRVVADGKRGVRRLTFSTEGTLAEKRTRKEVQGEINTRVGEGSTSNGNKSGRHF